MGRFPPNYDPKIYTLSAVIIGLALIDNFTASEQNAIGNWFITIGQTLENNSAWQQVIEERVVGNTVNINSQEAKNGGSPYMHNKPLYPDDATDTESNQNGNIESDANRLEALEKTLQIMQKEIEALKRKQ